MYKVDARFHHKPEMAVELITAAAKVAGSQSEVAERCGVSHEYLKGLLNGQETMSYTLQVTLQALANIEKEVARAYQASGSIAGTAALLNISYPTAANLLSTLSVKMKARGYNRPELPISGNQCRHAREYLAMTRDAFCSQTGVGKTTLRQFELGKSTPRKETIERILDFFAYQKIEFLDDGTFRPIMSCRVKIN